MDIIKRAILFGGKAIVTVIDSTQIAQDVIDMHKFSQPVAKAMGRLLTMTAFMSGNFKSEGNKLTLIVEGDGEIGKMVACGDYGAKVRAYCENPKAGLISPNLCVSDIVGKVGNLTVIKDFGLKNPYNGCCQLVNGSISGDFAYYFTVSEQLPSAVALGCEVTGRNCIKCGGVIVQPMPNCEEEILFILEDIVSNFGDVADLLHNKSPQEILEFYFGHFEINYLEDILPTYKCSCSQDKIERMILTLGYEQAMDILKEQQKIQVNCEFCNKKYIFEKQQIESLFRY